MRPRGLPRKILDRGQNELFALFGKDAISGAQINKRADLEQLGTDYGGWVVPTGLLGEGSVCYCAGCGEDISFDLQLIEQFGCEVHGFDPTPRSIAHVASVAGDNPDYHFHDLGLWDKADSLKFFVPRDPAHVSHSLVNLQGTDDFISVNVERLSNVMAELGHSELDLLKIDIEGAEYKVIDSLIEDQLDVKILCVEYDECYNPLDADYKQRIRASVDKLIGHGYSMVCAQGKGNYTFIKEA